MTTKDKAIAENGQDTNIKVTTKDKDNAENGQDTNIKVTTKHKVKKWRANITQVLYLGKIIISRMFQTGYTLRTSF